MIALQPLRTTIEFGRLRQPRVTILAIIVSLAFFRPMHAQVPCPYDDQGSFVVYTDVVALPSGYFLLVRKADKTGAIRITSVTQDTKTQPKVGEWIGAFTYESFYREGSSSSFVGQPAVRHTGQVDFRRMVGWSFHTGRQPGNHTALVGPWKFHFTAERWVFMSAQNFWKVLPGFEVAPTSACDINQIDANDPHLHWYSPNPNREGINIPVSKLPGRKLAHEQEAR